MVLTEREQICQLDKTATRYNRVASFVNVVMDIWVLWRREFYRPCERLPDSKVKLCQCLTTEVRRLRVFENRLLMRIFGPKKEEVTGDWRKLHNEGRNNLHSKPNIIRVIKSRRMRWTGQVMRVGERRGVHIALVGKPVGKGRIWETQE
jgi:hypothetical protein